MTMTMERENQTVELETTAKLAGVELQTKAICDKWLLLCYDMPHSEAGDKARAEFLVEAKKIGACKNTESVYLIPYSAAAGEAILKLAVVGTVRVFTSQSLEPIQDIELTHNYDQEIKDRLKELSHRVDRSLEMVKEGKHKALANYRVITDEQMASLGEAIRRRESLDLTIIYEAIKARYVYA